ncbi:MAG: hypothetical protein ACPHI0_09680, partial [Paracoccaceae bacterium]
YDIAWIDRFEGSYDRNQEDEHDDEPIPVETSDEEAGDGDEPPLRHPATPAEFPELVRKKKGNNPNETV